MVVKVHVIYCGEWGYHSRFNKFRDHLSKQFTEDDIELLEVTGEKTPGVSGEFEVQVEGKLIHSKKGGQGFPSEETMDTIVQAIRDVISLGD